MCELCLGRRVEVVCGLYGVFNIVLPCWEQSPINTEVTRQIHRQVTVKYIFQNTIFHFERIIWKTQSLSLFTIRTVLLSALNIHWLCHTNIDTHILAANISSPFSPIWSRCCTCPTKRQTIIGKPFHSHKLIRFRLDLTGPSDDQQCDTMLHILPNALAPSRQYPYHLTHYLYIIIIHSSNLLTTPRVHCVRMHMAEWPSQFTQLHFTIYTKFTMYINIEL